MFRLFPVAADSGYTSPLLGV